MTFQTPSENIVTLIDLMIGELSTTPVRLRKAITVFHDYLKTLTSTDLTPEQKAEVARLIDLLQADGATSISGFLTSLDIPKGSADLEQLQEAVTLLNTYLRITLFMEQIDVNALVPKNLRTDLKKNYQPLLAARAALRAKLAEIRDADVDLLDQLLLESANLLQTPTVNVGPLIDHLRNARDFLRQLKRDNVDLDDELVGKLIENWQAAIERLPDPNSAVSAVSEEDRRAAMAQTLDVHNLLEAIYDLLSQDVSVENPLDLVSL